MPSPMNSTALGPTGVFSPACARQKIPTTAAAPIPAATVSLPAPPRCFREPVRRIAKLPSPERFRTGEGITGHGGAPRPSAGLAGALDRERDDVGGALEPGVLARRLVLVHVVVGAHQEVFEPLAVG